MKKIKKILGISKAIRIFESPLLCIWQFECSVHIFRGPCSRLMDVLVDAREVLRNDALLLLIQLTKGHANLQKIVAFENAFDKLCDIMETVSIFFKNISFDSYYCGTKISFKTFFMALVPSDEFELKFPELGRL